MKPDDNAALLIIGVFIGFAVWIAASWWIATYAKGKGHSFAGFLLLGLLISPIISLIVALVVEDRRVPRSTDGAEPQDHLDRLKKLTELRDAGTLSPEEFEAEKTRILAERS